MAAVAIAPGRKIAAEIYTSTLTLGAGRKSRPPRQCCFGLRLLERYYWPRSSVRILAGQRVVAKVRNGPCRWGPAKFQHRRADGPTATPAGKGLRHPHCIRDRSLRTRKPLERQGEPPNWFCRQGETCYLRTTANLSTGASPWIDTLIQKTPDSGA